MIKVELFHGELIKQSPISIDGFNSSRSARLGTLDSHFRIEWKSGGRAYRDIISRGSEKEWEGRACFSTGN